MKKSFKKVLENMMGVRNPETLQKLLDRGFVDSGKKTIVGNYRILESGNQRLLYNSSEDRVVAYYEEEEVRK